MSERIAQAHDQLTAYVGRTTRHHLGSVRAHDFERFAYAVGHLDPIVPQGAVAAEAPPVYLSAVLGWGPGPVEGELRADGSEATATGDLPLEGLRLMGAGQALELYAPVTEGLDLTVDVGVDAVELKHGRNGDLLLLSIVRRYADQNEAPVLTCRESFIAR